MINARRAGVCSIPGLVTFEVDAAAYDYYVSKACRDAYTGFGVRAKRG